MHKCPMQHDTLVLKYKQIILQLNYILNISHNDKLYGTAA